MNEQRRIGYTRLHQLRTLLFGVSLLAGSASASTGRIAVKVTPRGPLPKQFYFAVVPIDHPLRSPLDERILSAGETVFEVPAGNYQIIAAAPDYATAISGIMRVIPSGETPVALPLEYLSALSGRVVDNNESPIKGARVGPPGSFRLDYVERLSDSAEAFLASNMVATSDETGSFLLPVRAVGKYFLYIEANGYAPAMLADQHAATGTVGDIRLQRGSALTVNVTGAHAHSPYDRLRLLPQQVELPASMSRAGAIALWSRRLTSRAQWSSLPAGQYDLCAGVAPDADPKPTPRCIAHFTLRPGDRREVTARLPQGEFIDRAKRSAVTIRLSGAKAEDLRSLQVIRRSEGRDTMLPSPMVKTAGSVITLVHGCELGASFTILAPTLIAATGPLTSCEPLPVVAHPRATVSLRLTVPPGTALPRDAVFHLEHCEGASVFARSLSVDSRGVVTFPIPHDCREGRVTAASLASRPLFHLASPGKGVAVEPVTVPLEASGSITARVASTPRQPAAGMPIEIVDANDLHQPVAAAITDAHGWFSVSLQPGKYVVRGRAHGLASFSTEPYELRPLDDAYLPDIVLLRTAAGPAH